MNEIERLRADNRELRIISRRLAHALRKMLEDLPDVDWVADMLTVCDRVLEGVKPAHAMSDEEYARDEERKERIRNQRTYEGDCD